MRNVICIVSLFIAMFNSAVLGEWKEPADGKISEKQLTAYLGGIKEWNKTLRAAGKAMEGSSGAGSLAMAMRTSEKLKAIIKNTGLEEEEFNWIGTKTVEAYALATLQKNWEEVEKPNLEKQVKKNADDQAALKTRITNLEDAQKSGNKVLTKEQREEAIKSATSERDSAKEELKGKLDEIKGVQDEAAAKDKEASDKDTEAAGFEKLAKTPPADVTEENKAGYIEEQKNNAKASRDTAVEVRNSAKEIRGRVADLQKDADAMKSRIKSAEAKMEHPEVPGTTEEKDQLQKENSEALKQANAELEQNVEAGKLLKEALEAGPKQWDALFNQGETKIPAENVSIMRKHMGEWEEAWGTKK